MVFYIMPSNLIKVEEYFKIEIVFLHLIFYIIVGIFYNVEGSPLDDKSPPRQSSIITL